MPTIVGIKFKTTGKVYYFDPLDIQFEVGEGAIVETARGVEYGTVSIANREMLDKHIVGTLKSVKSKATAADTEKHLKNLERKAEVMAKAREKIEARKLEMRLKDVDFTFDNSKIIFYFTAEGRVDFRELVKDLASLFHSRIELRQIGIRDETKMLGGLGSCGRACCCNAFLNDFERVSIKMAKTQGLSLNPAKISGLCGRLMCCLKYENDHYSETARLMPKQGSEITTPDGKATVENIDLLTRKIKARLNNDEGGFEIKTYDLSDIKGGKTLAEDVENSPDNGDDEIESLLD